MSLFDTMPTMRLGLNLSMIGILPSPSVYVVSSMSCRLESGYAVCKSLLQMSSTLASNHLSLGTRLTSEIVILPNKPISVP
jgi:hypothetical protein